MIFLYLVITNIYSTPQCLAQNLNASEDGVPVEELGSFLVDLDKKILRMLILPEKGQGGELLDYLDKFWKNFRYLDGLVVLNEQKAFRPAKQVMESECPSFVEQTFDVSNMKDTYKWKSAQFAEFKEYLLIIAGLSQKFKNDFANMKIDVDTLFQRPYNNENYKPY